MPCRARKISSNSGFRGAGSWACAEEPRTAGGDHGAAATGGSGCGSDLVTPPAYGTKAKIKMAIDANGPSGGTPSGSAMRDAQMIKELRDPERKQYVVLITDGGPGCSGEPDTCSGTAGQIRNAFMASPSIATFVVGFGGGLSASEAQCMTQMADAGGKPAMTPEKYYKADNDVELNMALSNILEVITGGGDVGMGSVCDDTCYSNGCPTPGDLCVKGVCKSNPCAGVSCGAKNSYCSSDGSNPGVCVSSCNKVCAKGTRCTMGTCSPDPCPYFCGAGLVCDAGQKRCVADPLCQGLPPERRAKARAAAVLGCAWTIRAAGRAARPARAASRGKEAASRFRPTRHLTRRRWMTRSTRAIGLAVAAPFLVGRGRCLCRRRHCCSVR